MLNSGAAAGAPPPRAALLGAIQGGAKLRKATTNDRSIAQGAGHVVSTDDDITVKGTHTANDSSVAISPSESAGEAVRGSSVEKPIDAPTAVHASGKRQSVDWYGGLAADHYPSPTTTASATQQTLPEVTEEPQEEDEAKDYKQDSSQHDTSTSASTDTTTVDGDPNEYFDMANCKVTEGIEVWLMAECPRICSD